MNLRLAPGRSWPRLLAAAALLCSRSPDAGACGDFFGPPVYLDHGGKLTEEPPEFYWELELKRLAQSYHPREKLVRALDPAVKPARRGLHEAPDWDYEKFTTAQDERDFADALRTGRLRVADTAAATKQHLAARQHILDGRVDPLPAEAPSEFADYHRGAQSFHQGWDAAMRFEPVDPASFPAARAAWEALLARPPEQRHYRSVWAALMLGKACRGDDEPAAVRWYQRTRELAAAGFADSLGLAADSYRWEALSAPETPAALWLHARLLRRAGKLTEAAQSLMRAWHAIEQTEQYTRWPHPSELTANPDGAERDTINFTVSGESSVMSFVQSVGGDYGALRLARGDFVAALDAFYKSTLWADAAYVAENVLTTDELQRYVDRQPPEPPRVLKAQDDTPRSQPETLYRSLRHLLGRRLLREHRPAEAARYLPAPYDKLARAFAQAEREGVDTKRPRQARARAWFHAGWIARYAGMELMGTEGEPDGFTSRGDTPPVRVRAERLAEEMPASAQPSAGELKRLRRTPAQPDVRFHYRTLGAQLMMKAASLLPDNSPELANVIERAGLIATDLVDDNDDDWADQWYQQLERRCEKTAVGQAAMLRHWYVPDTGAWSNEERAWLKKMLNVTPRPDLER